MSIMDLKLNPTDLARSNFQTKPKTQMKNWILGVVLSSFLSFGLSAQNQRMQGSPTPQQRAERMAETMLQELKLSDQQFQQVKQLLLENAEMRQEAIQQGRQAMEARREAATAQEEKITSILTEEQRLLWEAWKEKRRSEDAGGGNRRFPKNRGPRGEK